VNHSLAVERFAGASRGWSSDVNFILWIGPVCNHALEAERGLQQQRMTQVIGTPIKITRSKVSNNFPILKTGIPIQARSAQAQDGVGQHQC
jgi:hypothetical protein